MRIVISIEKRPKGSRPVGDYLAVVASDTKEISSIVNTEEEAKSFVVENIKEVLYN
jgi:hypothetical protein